MAVTAATGSIIDARSGCGRTLVFEKAVTFFGKVGLVSLVCPCNISFVFAFLVEFGTTSVWEQLGQAISIPVISGS